MKAPIAALTFDCFGTLIDWRGGQLRVLQQLPTTRPFRDRLHQLMAAREAAEQKIQTGPYLSYESILARSLTIAVEQCFSVELPAGEARAFAAGQLGWPAHSDTVPALARLAAAFPVSLLSNCDHELLELCARKHLGVPVQHLISAESVQSYKPQPNHWLRFLEVSGLSAEQVLHVSFTADYDFATARELGFQLGFVGRYQLDEPSGYDFYASAPTLEAFASEVLAKASG